MQVSPLFLKETRRKVAQQLYRFSGGDREMAEDAASFGLTEALGHMPEIIDQQDGGELTLESRVYVYVKTAANSELGRLRRYKQRTHSTNEKASDEEGEEREKGDLVTAKSCSASSIERYCDAMKVARVLAGMAQRDIDLFMLVAEGLTAEGIAQETGLTPGEVRIERERVLRSVEAHLHTDGWRGTNGSATPLRATA